MTGKRYSRFVLADNKRWLSSSRGKERERERVVGRDNRGRAAPCPKFAFPLAPHRCCCHTSGARAEKRRRAVLAPRAPVIRVFFCPRRANDRFLSAAAAAQAKNILYYTAREILYADLHYNCPSKETTFVHTHPRVCPRRCWGCEVNV